MMTPCDLATFKSLLNAGTVVWSRFNDSLGNFAKADCLVASVQVTLEGVDGVFVMSGEEFEGLTCVQKDRIRNAGASITLDGDPSPSL